MWTHNLGEDTIDVRGRELDKTKKFKKHRAERTGRDRHR